MRRVITVNLGGNAFQLDEDAYERLRAYVSLTDSRLGSNPDRAEILGDLERAVADHIVANRTASNSIVVSDREMEQALVTVGTVERPDVSPAEPAASGTTMHGTTQGTTQGTHETSYQGTTSAWDRPDESEYTRLPVLLLCLVVGWLGIHRFFVGKIGTGVLMLLTLGGLGIWVVIDVILIVFGAFEDRDDRKILRWA